MSIRAFIGAVLSGLKSSASVSTVYGKPIHASGKTLIPVARVAYGFGGGGETEKKGMFGKRDVDTEEGGGGGVAVRPVGVLEVTGRRTRFVPISRKGRLIGLLALGFAAGFAWSRKKTAGLVESAEHHFGHEFARGHK